jgi:hypothetical protein
MPFLFEKILFSFGHFFKSLLHRRSREGTMLTLQEEGNKNTVQFGLSNQGRQRWLDWSSSAPLQNARGISTRSKVPAASHQRRPLAAGLRGEVHFQGCEAPSYFEV